MTSFQGDTQSLAGHVPEQSGLTGPTLPVLSGLQRPFATYGFWLGKMGSYHVLVP